MKLFIFIIACLVVSAFAAPLTSRQYELVYTKFVEQYNRQYEVGEFFQRFTIFKSNLDLILAHNAQNLSWTMAINQFTDLSTQEFESMMGLNVAVPPELDVEYEEYDETTSLSEDLEASIDWIAKGKVNTARDQGSCGSCWAFGAISALESAIAIKTGKLPQLSEQQLVSCDKGGSSHGCQGGSVPSAYNYLKNHQGGACTRSKYPYTGKDDKCQHSKCSGGPKPTGHVFIAANEKAHIAALKTGPVAVSLACSSANFQFYSKGILTVCPDRRLNHVVVIVGHGTQNGQGYFKVRNSWGAKWGIQGNILMATGKTLCGITTTGGVQPRV